MFDISRINLEIGLVELNLLPLGQRSVIGKELNANAIGQEALLLLQSFEVFAIVFCESPLLRDEDLQVGKLVKCHRQMQLILSPSDDQGT
jgi:hypothetical protein